MVAALHHPELGYTDAEHSTVYQPVQLIFAPRRMLQTDTLPMRCTETNSAITYLFDLGSAARQSVDVSVGSGNLAIVVTYVSADDHLIRYAYDVALPLYAREDSALFTVEGDTLIVTLKKHVGLGAFVTQLVKR